MSGGFDRRPGGGSLVESSQGGGAAAAPGKQSLAEQVDRRPATGVEAGGLRPAEDESGEADAEAGGAEDVALPSHQDEGDDPFLAAAGKESFAGEGGAEVSAAPVQRKADVDA